MNNFTAQQDKIKFFFLRYRVEWVSLGVLRRESPLPLTRIGLLHDDLLYEDEDEDEGGAPAARPGVGGRGGGGHPSAPGLSGRASRRPAGRLLLRNHDR